MNSPDKTEEQLSAQEQAALQAKLSVLPSEKPYLEFKLIEIEGEPLSHTILRERGSY